MRHMAIREDGIAFGNVVRGKAAAPVFSLES